MKNAAIVIVTSIMLLTIVSCEDMMGDFFQRKLQELMSQKIQSSHPGRRLRCSWLVYMNMVSIPI